MEAAPKNKFKRRLLLMLFGVAMGTFWYFYEEHQKVDRNVTLGAYVKSTSTEVEGIGEKFIDAIKVIEAGMNDHYATDPREKIKWQADSSLNRVAGLALPEENKECRDIKTTATAAIQFYDQALSDCLVAWEIEQKKESNVKFSVESISEPGAFRFVMLQKFEQGADKMRDFEVAVQQYLRFYHLSDTIVR